MKTWTKKQRSILGLSEKESGLVDVLHKKGSLNTSSLASESRLPRVTAMRILKALHERGFVTRKEKGKEALWELVSPVELESRLASVFNNSSAFSKSNINLSEVGSLTVYRGAKEMLESNRKLLIAHAGERLLTIEPNGIWKHFGRIASHEWESLNRAVKEKQIQIEMVVEEGFELALKEEVDPGIEESFLSLAVDIRVVPARVLDSSTEIIIFRDLILFMDWGHLVAVEVKNPSTTRVIKAMFRMLQKSGREL
jgi:sugar-specific transcriptional regulator TrmB